VRAAYGSASINGETAQAVFPLRFLVIACQHLSLLISDVEAVRPISRTAFLPLASGFQAARLW
jgi:hypothetical protein